jgi:lysylphosphatidylglycerol synthetase-like protein (DUF2156 family)
MTCHGLLYCVNLIVGLCTVPLAHVSLGCKISPMLTRVGWSIVWVSSRKNISQKKAGRTEVFYFYIFFIFWKIYVSSQILQNYTIAVMWYDVRRTNGCRVQFVLEKP